MLKYRPTREFEHSCGRKRDPDNCGACALTDTRQAKPNYSAWPLVYMENHRAIPAKWRAAFRAELVEAMGSNKPYYDNLEMHIRDYGVTFTDGRPLEYTRVDAGTGRVKPLSDSDWPDNG